MSFSFLRSYALVVMSILIYTCEEPDTIAPRVAVTFPAHQSTVAEIVKATCVATDNIGIDYVELWVDGRATGLIDNEEPYSFTWNTLEYQNGSTHVLTARAHDTNDNVADSAPITVLVDQTAAYPDTALIYPVEINIDAYTVSWSSNRDDDFLSYELHESTDADMANSTIVFESNSAADTSYSVTPLLKDEYRYYQIYTQDQLELTSKSNIQVFFSATYLFSATFSDDWLCPDCGEGIIFVSDEAGNLLADTTWWGNGTIELRSPAGMSMPPSHISVTIVQPDQYGNLDFTTNLHVPTGSSWNIKGYPTWDWQNPIGTVEIDFQNIPEHEGYIFSSLETTRISSTRSISSPFLMHVFKEPESFHLKLNTTTDGPKSIFFNDLSAGNYTRDLSSMGDMDSKTIDIPGSVNGARAYLFGFPTPGNHYDGRYTLDYFTEYWESVSTVELFYPPDVFTDYGTNLYSFDRDDLNEYWFQMVYGEISESFSRVDVDFEYISTTYDDYNIQPTTSNYDEIISRWGTIVEFYDLYWNVHGPPDMSAYSLPELPASVTQLYPYLSDQTFSLMYTSLLEYPEIDSYESIIDISYRSPDRFFDVITESRARVKYFDYETFLDDDKNIYDQRAEAFELSFRK